MPPLYAAPAAVMPSFPQPYAASPCVAPPAANPFMPPPPFPPPGGQLEPPSKRHRGFSPGVAAIIGIILQKYPGTHQEDARARAVSMLRGRCTGCAQPRSGRTCMTPACNPAHLHPVLATEARAM